MALVRETDYATCETAIAEALEMSGLLAALTESSRVLLKPNLMRGTPPEACHTTHPGFVAALTRLLRSRGVEVMVGDSSGLLGFTRQVFEASGMARAVVEAGGRVLDLDAGPFRRVRSPGGREFLVPQVLFEVDLVVQVPKLKTHPLMTLSVSVKGLMGLLPGATKPALHVALPSSAELAEGILDLYEALVSQGVPVGPSVVDAVWVLAGRGGGRPDVVRHPGLVVAGSDLFSVDLACFAIAGFDAREAPLARAAVARGLAPSSLSSVTLLGEDPRAAGPPFERPSPDSPERYRWSQRAYYFLRSRLIGPRHLPERCRGSGVCATVCPTRCIRIVDGRPRVADGCIRCMACVASCPTSAFEPRAPRFLDWLLRKRLSEAGIRDRP